MALVAGEQGSGGEVRDGDGRLIVVGPGGVAIGGGGAGADPLSDGTPGGALPTKTLWIAGANGAVLQGLVADATGRLRTVVEGTPAVSVSNFPGTQPVSGTVVVSNFPATQPVSLATNTPDVTDRAARLLGHVTVDTAPTTAVTGPLTDTQLRASAVPTSLAALPALTAGAAVIGKVDQGTAGASAWKIDGSAVTQPVSLAAVPTVTEKQDQPASSAATWTSATGANTALTNSSVSGYGTANVSIQTPSTATAGVITIEVTDDGSVWYPAGAVRVDNTQQENIVTLAGPGVAQTRMYAVSVDAMTGIRARLSTAIVGAGNTVVRIGLVAGGIEPLVSVVPQRNPVTIYLDQVAGITIEALATALVIHRGDAAAVTGATTYAPTAGKTFRLTAITLTGHLTSAALTATKVRVRSLVSGTTTVTSPVRHHSTLRAPVTTGATGTAYTPVVVNADVAGLLDVPPGGSLGVSHVAGATAYVLDVCLQGYEL